MTTTQGSSSSSFGKTLSVTGAVLLTLSVVTPASSMFIIIPGVIEQAGTGVMISLAFAGALGLIVALVYAELACEFRSAGGEYIYVEKLFNDVSAYPVIVVNLVTQTFITSVLALGAGDYINAIVPINPVTTAVLFVAFATIFGILHIKTNAVITGFFFLAELTALGAVSYFGIRHIAHSPGIFFSRPVHSINGKLLATPFSVIAMATAAALFAFNGYEEAIYLNEEMKRPKLIGRAILISFVVGLILEATPTALTLLASNDISQFVDPRVSPYIELVGRVAGHTGVVFVSSVISLAVLNACIANVLLTARFVFSTGRSGLWGKRMCGPLTTLSRQDVPVWATLIVGVLGGAACVVPINTLFVLTGTGLVFIYAALCLAVISKRRKTYRSPAQFENGNFKMPLVPFLPLIGFVGLVGVLIANWADPTLGRPSIIVSAVEILIGIIWWFTRHKLLKVGPLNSVLGQSDAKIEVTAGGM